MPSPTDFNLSPYYDDYSEDKKFHRVLFRPAFSVQARELTQLQTIQQNQIERLSDHFFEKGTMVIPGEISYDLNYTAVKLTSFTGSATLSDFVGKTFKGATSGVIGTIINSVVTENTDPNTLYIKYQNAGTDNVSFTFSDGETLEESLTTGVLVSGGFSAVCSATATGSAANVASGVYYINGFMVSVSEQTIILDKYTATPSYRVGLTVSESFIQSTDDGSLLDNAQGSSNVNAPGADRFKITLTLTKKALTAVDDANFVELLRLKDGILQNQVRTTEYAILEDTLARRTFDESGDYVVRNFDLDLREHIVDGNNRGIFTLAEGGQEILMAAGLAPGKAYVRGYEIETIGTTFLNINKARDFDTQNNFNTRFDVGNYVHVKNVYNAPDVNEDSGGISDAFKKLQLFDVATSARGTVVTNGGNKVPEIGRAKSKGFHYLAGSASSFVFSSASLTDAIYRNFLFDIEMFTHLNMVTNTAYTDGEKVTGGTSGATGFVQDVTTETSETISGATAANPVVITATGHTLKEGQQVTIASVGGMTELNGNIYTVRNPGTNDFELYDTDGTTSINGSAFTSYTSGGTATHGVLVLAGVTGTFVAGETITGQTSTTAIAIQSDAVGFKGVRTCEFSATKSICQAGSPTHTSDTDLTSVYGEVSQLTGTVSIANSAVAMTGSGTAFQTELKVGDNIQFTTNAGTTLTRTVEAIISDTSITLSVAVGGSDVTSTVSCNRTRTKLTNSNKNTAIFKLPYSKIKTLKTAANSSLTDTNFTVRRAFVASLSSGAATLTAGTDETFTSLDEGDFTVSLTAAGSGSGTVGDILSLTGNNGDGDAIFELGGSPSGKTLKIDFGSAYANATIKVLATVSRSVGNSKTKTLNSNSTTQVTSQTVIENGTIGLGKADVFVLNSVKMAADFSTDAVTSDTDITSRFDLDTGQRDNYYDIGRIKLKAGEVTPTGRLLVNFDYFTHDAGDYFDIDSYTDGGIDYERVPTYTSDTTGVEFELSDCLDFRPRVDDESGVYDGSTSAGRAGEELRRFTGSNYSTVDVVKFGSNVSSDFEYYLPRIDKIFIDKEGVFKILSGAAALQPQVPGSLAGALHLYTLEIPAYTLSTEDVTIKKIDNRRFTMRDIGKLQDRIENLEYYTQLSLLETQAQNLQIQDSSGFDRFKNGFIVDNFTGHNIGDVGSADYKCSVDMAQGELRPMFTEDAVKLIEADDDGTVISAADRTSANYQKTGDLITLPYTEVTLIDQPFASKTLNVNPFDVRSFAGTVELDPPGDEWKETERAPELVVNNVGGFDTLVSNLGNSALNGFEIGTVWNEWQDNWTGRPVDITTRDTSGNQRAGRRIFRTTEITSTQQVQQTRTGIRQTIVPQTVRNSIGDRIVSVAFVPFIRSRTVNFEATLLKPNTRVFPFFDNIDVSAYITPTGGAQGGNLVSDDNGAVSGTFSIPDPTVDANPRWRTGQRVFRLTSSSTDNRTDVQTSAEADYLARGILETVQNTIISTREPRIVRSSTSEDRSISRTSTRDATRTVGWHDPLAQTFLIDDVGGVFMTSIDIFFSSKSDNIPVTLQIREVVNGYPGNKILPFSEITLNPSSVSTSTDTTTATNFAFKSPVYIQENTEYCIVLLANTTDYTVYASRLGETVIGSDRTISQQPYAGVLFKSQNGSTWTADQNEDLKFKIKRAEYSNVSGQLSLVNDALEVKSLKQNPVRTTNSSAVVRVFHKAHGMHGTSNNVTIAGFETSTSYNGITGAQLNGTYTSISNVTIDSYDITSSGTATSTGDTGGTGITASQNRLFDTAVVSLQTMEVPGTNIVTDIRTTGGRSVHGSETEFALQGTSARVAVVPNDNIYFTSPRMVASQINETTEMAGSKSLFVRSTLTTTNTKLTPVIDLSRASMFTVQNRLNTPTSGNTPDFIAETNPTGGSSSAQYITRPITLENASTALDVRLTANIRSSSEVEVYYRATSSEITSDIKDLAFIPFNTAGEEDVTVAAAENDTTFNEYKYTVTGIAGFTAFQIKIVMKGSISSYPPRIRDLRGIALAV